MQYVKRYKTLTFLAVVIAISVVWMHLAGTLLYPYIMVSRQIQMIKYCQFGSNEFKTNEFGFNIKIPDEYCFLPHRIFPRDGSVQVLPKGAYFVINEYAKGTVIEASKSTLLFEPIIPTRNTKDIMQTLKAGKFLEEASESDLVNKSGLKVHLARNVRGVDSASHYDWAFIEHPNGEILLSILLSKIQEPEIFDYIVDNIESI